VTFNMYYVNKVVFLNNLLRSWWAFFIMTEMSSGLIQSFEIKFEAVRKKR
jgi:hypothetical protein